MFCDEDLAKYLKVVEVKLLKDLDVTVEYTDDCTNNYFYYEEGIIEIGSKQPLMIQLYSLLHEAGHAYLRDSKYFVQRKEGLKRYRRSYRVDVLREEIMAWENGYNLAADLGIPIDTKEWNKFRTSSLFKYIVWAYDPRNYKPPK